MTKAELIKSYQKATKQSGVQAKEQLEQLGGIMAAELLAGGEVFLPGIGTLVVKPTAARTGRNPRTGKPLQIPAGKKVVLRAGKKLKDSLK